MGLYAVTVTFFSGRSVVHYLCAYTQGAASNNAVLETGAVYATDTRFCGLI